jgi:hypothetical protein
MAVLGLIFSKPSKPGYFCIESGLAHWDIKSTYAPLVDFKTNKMLTALLIGAEFPEVSNKRRFFVEMGWETIGFGKANIFIPEEQYGYTINSVANSFVLSAGIKF